MPFIVIWVFFAALELFVLIEVGSQIGTLNTILLIMFTAIAGISVMVRQGMGVLQRAQIAAMEGRSPAVEIVEAILLVLAGIMLFIPGFVSDITGILLLTPLRALLAKSAIGSWVAKHAPSGQMWQSHTTFGNNSPNDSNRNNTNTIEDAEYEHIDSDK